MKRQKTKLLCFDFETFFDAEYSLRKKTLSTSKYIRDPRFEALCLGYQWEDDPYPRLVLWSDIAAFIRDVNWKLVEGLAHHCLRGDVEVLTKTGWQALEIFQPTQEVMQWCPDTERLSWTLPSAKTTAAARELLSWKSQYHECAYTNNHRMFYSTPDVSRWRAVEAEHVAAMSTNNVYVPLGGVFESRTCLDLSPLEAQLMEAIRADGSWCLQDGKCYGFRFTLKKRRKLSRLRQLSEKLGLTYQKTKRADGAWTLRFPASAMSKKLFALLGKSKLYGQWLLDLSVGAREAILDEAVHWDGHHSTRRAANSFVVTTKHRQVAEAFQLMAHCTGWSGQVATRNNQRGFTKHVKSAVLHHVSLRKKRKAKLLNAMKRVKHDAAVYCLTVPTGALLIRSHGKVCVTGNSHFDGLILSHHYGKSPAIWRDSLSMGRAVHGANVSADLDSLSQHYGIGGKMFDLVKHMKGIRRPTGTLLAGWSDYCKKDVADTLHVYRQMLPSFPANELELVDMTVRMFTDPVLRIDRKLATAELKREQKDKAKKLRRAKVDVEEMQSAEQFAQLLRDKGVQPPLKNNKDGQAIYAFAKTDRALQDLRLHEDEQVRDLIEARLAAKSTIGESRAQAMLDRSRRGARLPIYLNFAKAHTLRWSGGDSFNPQNLPAAERGGRISKLRQCIMAPPGQLLAIADQGQIEARVTAVLAGQDDLIEAFADRSRDVYCEFGTEVSGTVVTKADKEARFVAKTCVLGLGFGMGPARLQYTLALGTQGPPVFLTFERCCELVAFYRSKYKRIVALWETMQNLIPVLAHGPRTEFGPMVFDKGRVEMPNGLALHYPMTRIGPNGDWEYWLTRKFTKIYGGLFTENTVQSLARILIGEQLPPMRPLGRLVMCTHDEAVNAVKRARAKAALAEMIRLMEIPPKWMPNIPLKVEGHVARRYEK